MPVGASTRPGSAEFRAISGAATRIRVEDDVAVRGVFLLAEAERHIVHGVRPAVDLQDQGVLLGRV